MQKILNNCRYALKVDWSNDKVLVLSITYMQKPSFLLKNVGAPGNLRYKAYLEH